MPKITTDRYYIKTFANLSRTMTRRKRRRKNNKRKRKRKIGKRKEKRKMLMSRKKIFHYEFFLTII